MDNEPGHRDKGAPVPRTTVDIPVVEQLSILAEDGTIDTDLEPAIPPDDLRRLYRTFLLARRFDERMLRLQRQGRIGTFGPTGPGGRRAGERLRAARRRTGSCRTSASGRPTCGAAGRWRTSSSGTPATRRATGCRTGPGLAALHPHRSQVPARGRHRLRGRYKGEATSTSLLRRRRHVSRRLQEAMNFAGVFRRRWSSSARTTSGRSRCRAAKQTRVQDDRAEGGRLRLPRRPGRRQRPARDLRRDPGGGRAGAYRRRPDARSRRVTYRLRCTRLPTIPTKYRGRGRGQGVGGQGADAALPQLSREQGPARRRGAARLEADVEAGDPRRRSSGPRLGHAELPDGFDHVYAEPPPELEAQREELQRDWRDSATASSGMAGRPARPTKDGGVAKLTMVKAHQPGAPEEMDQDDDVVVLGRTSASTRASSGSPRDSSRSSARSA